jgi:hypothetical protein
VEKDSSAQNPQWLYTVPWTPQAAAWVEDKLAAELGPDWRERAAEQRAKHARQRRASTVSTGRSLVEVLSDGLALIAAALAERSPTPRVGGY